MGTLTTCPRQTCGGFLDSHGCESPWACGVLRCRDCGVEVAEATGRVILSKRLHDKVAEKVVAR